MSLFQGEMCGERCAGRLRVCHPSVAGRIESLRCDATPTRVVRGGRAPTAVPHLGAWSRFGVRGPEALARSAPPDENDCMTRSAIIALTLCVGCVAASARAQNPEPFPFALKPARTPVVV